MAYNGYGNNSYGGGYGQSNPYDDRGASFDTRGEQPPPSYGGQNVEMQPLGGQQYGQPAQEPPRDPNAILNDCRAVGRAIDDLESRLGELQRVQRIFISGNGGSNKEVDSMSADIMTGYRGLGDRVRRIKSQPDAKLPRNNPQVEALDRRIRKAINSYQQVEANFRREVQEQQRRQYLIVKPDATEQELHEVTQETSDTQIFQQALMNGDRRAGAQSTLSNVKQRHDAMQQIERTMMELAQLFEDLNTQIVLQDQGIQDTEQKAVETHENLEAGNVHVDKAGDSAQAARKKKWICFGIVVAIILVIVIIVIIWAAVTGKFASGNDNGGGGAAPQ